MAQTTQQYNGKVKYPSDKVFSTKYGERRKVVVITDQGEDITVFGYADNQIIQSLSKGDPVTVTKDGNKFKVAPLSGTTPQRSNGNQPAPSAGITIPREMAKEEKVKMMNYTKDLVHLYKAIREEVVKEFDKDLDLAVPEETIRTATTTIFIQTTRKFNL